jgi:Glycosyl transferase family 2
MMVLPTVLAKSWPNSLLSTPAVSASCTTGRMPAKAPRSVPRSKTRAANADLEYDPSEYPKVLGPLLANKADVVYGSRFLISGERRVIYYWHSFANHLLTTACNMAADLNLTDMETCYKAFRVSLLQRIPIRSNRFGIEPEITIKFAKRQASVAATRATPLGCSTRRAAMSNSAG